MLRQTVPKYGQQQQGMPDHQQWTTVTPCTTDIQRQWWSWSKASTCAPKSAVHAARYDGAVPCKHLYTRIASVNWILSSWCSQPVQLAEERSDVVIPRRREHESHSRVRDRLELLQKIRSCMECQPGLHCRSPVVTGRLTTSVTGERVWEVTDGHSEAVAAPRSRQQQSLQRVTSWRRLNQGRCRGHEPQTPMYYTAPFPYILNLFTIS